MPTPPPARSALGARSQRHPAAPAEPPPAQPAAAAPARGAAPAAAAASSEEATVPLSVRVPRSLRTRVKRAALDDDTSVQDWVIAAVEQRLAAEDR